MRTMKRLRKAGPGLLLLVTALALACTRRSVPLTVPGLADVESIYVSRMEGSRMVWSYMTKDRGRIGAILDHLRAHNPDEYRIETDLYVRWVNPRLPDYEYDIIVFSPVEVLLGIAVGPDWLGGEDDLERFPNQRRLNLYRRRPLGAAERAALVPLLQMKPGDEDMLGRHED